MNLQNLLSSFSENADQRAASNGSKASNPLTSLSSMLPGGLAGGAAAGGIMALLMGSKSTRKLAKKAVKYGGTAIVGGLAYKAYDNWQKNKALGQTQPITDQDIQQASASMPQQLTDQTAANAPSLEMLLINTMIAATKADGQIDAQENKRLFEAIEKLNLQTHEKAAVFDAMANNMSVQEIANSIRHEEHKAEVYLSAYLAIEVDEKSERTFLNNLAIALELPKGFPAYLEQQADQGIAA